MPVPLIYISLCFLAAFCGLRHKFGFWGILFCSFALTPVIGFLLILGNTKPKKEPARFPK